LLVEREVEEMVMGVYRAVLATGVGGTVAAFWCNPNVLR
jgi:hypothetical protein